MSVLVVVFVVGTKLKYLQCCGILVLMHSLIVVFIVGITIEISPRPAAV